MITQAWVELCVREAVSDQLIKYEQTMCIMNKFWQLFSYFFGSKFFILTWGFWSGCCICWMEIFPLSPVVIIYDRNRDSWYCVNPTDLMHVLYINGYSIIFVNIPQIVFHFCAELYKKKSKCKCEYYIKMIASYAW